MKIVGGSFGLSSSGYISSDGYLVVDGFKEAVYSASDIADLVSRKESQQRTSCLSILIGLGFTVFLVMGSTFAFSFEPLRAVKDMSNSHVEWALKESARMLEAERFLQSYIMLEYYFLRSEEDKEKVVLHVHDHPDVLAGGLISFNRLGMHDSYKKFGFDKVQARQAVDVRLRIFKELASDQQYLKAAAMYDDYFSEKAMLVASKVKDESVKNIEVPYSKNREFGDWHSTVSRDDFTDEVVAEAFVFGRKVYNNHISAGVRCMSGEVKMTFDMVRFVNSGGRPVNIRYRVDRGGAGVLNGYVYSNSTNSGFSVEKIQEDLVIEMKAGSRILIEVSNRRRSSVRKGSFALNGFTGAYDRVLQNCK